MKRMHCLACPQGECEVGAKKGEQVFLLLQVSSRTCSTAPHMAIRRGSHTRPRGHSGRGSPGFRTSSP